jgi:hypothetical protein
VEKKFYGEFQRFIEEKGLYENSIFKIIRMKTITSIILTVMLFIACTTKETDLTPISNPIVGKWSPTYITQSRKADGTWEPFVRINTFVALPTYEFTADGRFLRDGMDGADCCTSGSKYTILNDVITFTERQTCPNVKCIACDNWAVIEIKNDTLILEECGRIRNKFVRIK